MDDVFGIIGKHKTEIATPALMLDLDVVKRNIAKMAHFFAEKECRLRPHYKTHKLPLIAHQQIRSGAIGITCAKLGEAEALLHSGIRDVLLANQVVNIDKIRELVGLSRLGNLAVCVDSDSNACAISEVACANRVRVPVLVELNIGLNRCGVPPEGPALDFIQRLMALPGVSFRGIMAYEGGMFIRDAKEKARQCQQALERLVTTRYLVEKSGIKVEIVSAGGTNTYQLTGTYPGVTEVQVGSYVTMDSYNQEFGVDFEQALTVMATVISRPEKNRAVIDAGMKSLSCDHGMPLCIIPGISITQLNEEHGHLGINNPDHDLKVGDLVEIIPSHGCTTTLLYDRYALINNERVESIAYLCPRHAI